MEAADIVEALNQFHEKSAGKAGGQFVLQKSLLPDESFKAYKKLSLVVWYVNGSSKLGALQVSKVARMTSDREIAAAYREACTELTRTMLDFVSGNDYVSLVYGAGQV